ncbi:hypothetical protein ACJIZ3_025555 [Penstemon smallii]|uniref:Polygalacturonase n=1 Tax=Penstemon smallii TaxID=265156 RepID=A0ABD3TUY8_9LAMI
MHASAVKISDVKYIGLRGTYISKNSIDFRCSKTIPCTNIVLDDIDIKPAVLHVDPNHYNNLGSVSVRCINAYGIVQDFSNPTLNYCLN